jgi:8-oxo-dGTP pyrophosphatase MutT (NUDIX family)
MRLLLISFFLLALAGALIFGLTSQPGGSPLPTRVKVIFRDQDGRYLVSQKKTQRGKKRKEGKWELLGGRIDPGETWQEALARELHEEDPTGVLPRVLKEQGTLFVQTMGDTYLVQARGKLSPEALEPLLQVETGESYGFLLVDELETKEKKHWTPRGWELWQLFIN